MKDPFSYKQIGDRWDRENYAPAYQVFFEGQALGVISREGSKWDDPPHTYFLRDHDWYRGLPTRRAAGEALLVMRKAREWERKGEEERYRENPDEPPPRFKHGDLVRLDELSPASYALPGEPQHIPRSQVYQVWAGPRWDSHGGFHQYQLMDLDTRHKLWHNDPSSMYTLTKVSHQGKLFNPERSHKGNPCSANVSDGALLADRDRWHEYHQGKLELAQEYGPNSNEARQAHDAYERLLELEAEVQRRGLGQYKPYRGNPPRYTRDSPPPKPVRVQIANHTHGVDGKRDGEWYALDADRAHRLGLNLWDGMVSLREKDWEYLKPKRRELGNPRIRQRKYFVFLNLDERGHYYADVRDGKGNTVWEVDEDGANELYESGFLKGPPHQDIYGLEKYLKEMGIIPQNADLFPSKEEGRVQYNPKGGCRDMGANFVPVPWCFDEDDPRRGGWKKGDPDPRGDYDRNLGKAWDTRRAKYGEGGLSASGEKAIAASNKRRSKGKRKRSRRTIKSFLGDF